MAFYTCLFDHNTYRSFLESPRNRSGYLLRQRKAAERVMPGDFLCGYIKGLSRWCTALKVVRGPFEEDTPIYGQDDPYRLRFEVEPVVVLPLELAIPIKHDKILFDNLSFTRGNQDGYWVGPLRQNLRLLSEQDGELILDRLRSQVGNPIKYPVDQKDLSKLSKRSTLRRSDGEVVVVVPADEEESESHDISADYQPTRATTRTSHAIQAKLARLGSQMGFRIWLPRNDRSAVLNAGVEIDARSLLDVLPLNYDEVTIKTIENIDVLWLRGRSIARAFEVEHTTAIYSGILRMADLIALQPNMQIALHIVAPSDRRDKVFSEIQRPVFSLIEGHPLAKRCSYLPYDAIDEIESSPHLNHLSDSVLEEYEEFAGDDW